MNLHLYTTDISGLDLARSLSGDDVFTAVVIPANRAGTDKIEIIQRQSHLPVVVHTPGELLAADAPPADAIVSWLYSQIIAVDLLNSYLQGGINMHGGRIPDYRGANALNWAIASGETRLGVTWHEIVEKVDAGGILAESSIPIGPNDTAADVRAAMIVEGIRLFPDAFKRFRDGDTPIRVPDLEQGRVWPSRRAQHGRIESNWPREKVWAMIRAQTGPWPDATVLYQGEWCSVCNIRNSDGPGLIPYTADDGAVFFLVPTGLHS